MDTVVCPKGHQSSDQDYCSECGAKIGNGMGAATFVPAVSDAEVCPDCGTSRDHKSVVFCEICGYNFTTGARGEIPFNYSAPLYPAPLDSAPLYATPSPSDAREVEPEVAEDVQEPNMAAPAHREWTVTVAVDQTYPQPDSPDPPADLVPFMVALNKPVNLIGRTSQTRAIFPEIAIDYDEAVSHRHALLQLDADGGLVLRDIGAANGTMVNRKEIKAMVDHSLVSGDVITLGHWSSITVKAEG